MSDIVRSGIAFYINPGELSRFQTLKNPMNIKNEIMSFKRVLSPRRAYVIYTPMGNRR